MQDNSHIPIKKDSSTLSNLIIPITYLLISIHFALNFLGLPIIKWFYLIEVIFVISAVVSLELNRSIIPIIALFFIEGQGRILWSYHPVMRVIFDFTLALAVLKSFSLKKSIFPKNHLPHIITFCIALHFLWYTLQIFNIYSVGIFPVIAASKIYIFPFILFFMFLNNPLTAKTFNHLQIFTLFIILLEGILSIYQMSAREASLLDLTQYYYKSLRQDIFVGINFRPYGTSVGPGAFSVYLFLTIGFLFLGDIKSFFKKALFTLLQILNFFCLFISQVRSALLKYALILFFTSLGLFLISKVKIKSAFHFASSIIILFITLHFLPNMQYMFPDIDFETSISRITALTEINKLGDHRATGDTVLNSIIKKLADRPLGLGPGRTGAAATMGADFIYADPVYDIHSSWTHDNLLVSLVIDLGVGAIFYVLVITMLLLRLIYVTFLTLHRKDYTACRIAMISMVSCVVIVIGNWGTLGLTYNPESFIFWFFMALGLNAPNISQQEK